METIYLPWRLDIGSRSHGWLLVRAGDDQAAAEARRAAGDAHYEIAGAPARIFDPRVGPALAYPLTPLAALPRMREAIDG
jgi:hypothetical protein